MKFLKRKEKTFILREGGMDYKAATKAVGPVTCHQGHEKEQKS